MMENLAVVIKLKGKKAYVVNDEGVFEIIKIRDGMFEGQKVFYNNKDIIENNRVNLKYISAALAGLAALFIFAYSFFNLFFIEETYAYIHIDINPSIELLIDENGKVLSALPINEEADRLLKNSKYIGLPLNSAILNLLYKSPDYGLSKNKYMDNFILISAALNENVDDVDNGNKNTILADMFDDLKEKVKSSQIDVTMQFMKFPSEYLEKAHKANVSMGRFYVYSRLKEKGSSISIEEIKRERLFDVMMENGIEPFDSERSDAALAVRATTSPGNYGASKETPYLAQTPRATPTCTATMVHQKVPTSKPGSVYENSSGGNKHQDAQENTQKDSQVKNSGTEDSKKGNNIENPVETPEAASRPRSEGVNFNMVTSSPLLAASGNTNKETGIKVQLYNYNAVEKTNIAFIRMKVINTGNKPVNLKDVKVRYYYTTDGDKEQILVIDWSSAGTENMKGKFVKMDSPKDKADTYLEIGFTSDAGKLEPGKNVEMTGRFNKEDWSNYNQTNDYSFSSAQKYKDSKNVTGYISGNLVWGVEP